MGGSGRRLARDVRARIRRISGADARFGGTDVCERSWRSTATQRRRATRSKGGVSGGASRQRRRLVHGLGIILKYGSGHYGAGRTDDGRIKIGASASASHVGLALAFSRRGQQAASSRAKQALLCTSRLEVAVRRPPLVLRAPSIVSAIRDIGRAVRSAVPSSTVTIKVASAPLAAVSGCRTRPQRPPATHRARHGFDEEHPAPELEPDPPGARRSAAAAAMPPSSAPRRPTTPSPPLRHRAACAGDAAAAEAGAAREAERRVRVSSPPAPRSEVRTGVARSKRLVRREDLSKFSVRDPPAAAVRARLRRRPDRARREVQRRGAARLAATSASSRILPTLGPDTRLAPSPRRATREADAPAGARGSDPSRAIDATLARVATRFTRTTRRRRARMGAK